MNAVQMCVVITAAVVLLTIHQFASVYQNMKEIHRLCHVNHQKMLVQFHLVDQIHNVLDWRMESLSAHVYQVLLKARTQFVVALNREVLANHSHAALELHVMLHVAQFALAQKEQLEIHLDNVHHRLLLKNFANRDHAEVRQTLN